MAKAKETILVVDDIEMNRIILREILQDTYEIEEAENGFEAISKMFDSVEPPQMVLLDIMMPEMDGYEVISVLKSSPATENIPVIFISAADEVASELKGLKLGAIDYITKPFEPESVRLRVNNYMELARYRVHLEQEVERRTQEVIQTKESMLATLARVIEYRDLESGQHVQRTSNLTAILIKQIMNEEKYYVQLQKDYQIIISAAPMHDIGKIAIPDRILQKPGALTDSEFEIIKTHTVFGRDIIETVKDMLPEAYYRHCCDICLHHHERWDGRGYPTGIAGEDIPLAARLLSVVDVYDALVSDRVYKRALSHEQAMNIIQENAGSQFDPDIVKHAMQIHEQFRGDEP